MKQPFLIPVAATLALMGGAALGASQDQPDGSRTFGERVKILLGFQKPAQSAPEPVRAAPAPDEEQKPVQTFNNVEIELDALGESLTDD